MAEKYYVVYVERIQQFDGEVLDRKLALGEIPSDTLLLTEKEYSRLTKRFKSWTDWAMSKYRKEVEKKVEDELSDEGYVKKVLDL